MKLAPEGRPQMILCTVGLGTAVALAGLWFWPTVIPLLVVWAWSIAFFRDPDRRTTPEPSVLCAPADGRVADVARLQRYEAIGGPALRLGIFLSLFDVHINRAPCRSTVRAVDYRRGKFLAAMNRRASEVNESNTVVLETADPMPGPVVVRQIAGVAARRIVCHARPGATFEAGQRFGMIKFGSRTELIVPLREGTTVLVAVGDRVRAGETPLIRQA